MTQFQAFRPGVAAIEKRDRYDKEGTPFHFAICKTTCRAVFASGRGRRAAQCVIE